VDHRFNVETASVAFSVIRGRMNFLTIPDGAIRHLIAAPHFVFALRSFGSPPSLLIPSIGTPWTNGQHLSIPFQSRMSHPQRFENVFRNVLDIRFACRAGQRRAQNGLSYIGEKARARLKLVTQVCQRGFP
jgi:hypothetical protein